MDTRRVQDFRDMHVTVSRRNGPTITGELTAIATPATDDPLGVHNAAVILTGDGTYLLISISTITTIRKAAR